MLTLWADVWPWLEQSAPSRALRSSHWLYPAINALHLLGMALLIGAILILDWRLLRPRPAETIGSLAKTLLAPARLGFLLAVIAGLLMFITRPLNYLANPVFLIKMALIVAALINVWLVHRSKGWQAALAGEQPVTGLRLAATLSILFWLGILFLGRLIGYR